MKPILLSLFIMQSLIAFAQEEFNPINKKTIITGQVSNFEKYADHDFIEVIYEDLLQGQITLLEDIDKNGQFKFELDIEFPKEFFLSYSCFVAYYISPGDSLHLDLGGESWDVKPETWTDEYSYYNISGTANKMNADYTKYIAFVQDSLDNWDVHESMINNSSPHEYKNFIETSTKERAAFIQEFNKKNNTGSQFREWVEYDLKFQAWDNLMRYRWLNPMHNKTDPKEFVAAIPEDYFNFIDDWDEENLNFLKSNSYLNFLNEYSGFQYQKIPKDAFAKPGTPNILDKNLKMRKDHILSHNAGYVQDVLLAKFLYGLLDSKFFEAIQKIYTPNEISNVYLANKVQEKFIHEKALFENPEFANGSKFNVLKNENDFLKTLVNTYPDKVIYLDFWAPWCAPCMKEMPHAAKVKKELAGKEVIFVYLGSQCDEGAWQTTIADKKIEGEHYLLTKKQYAHLSEIFGKSSLPLYVLIDKNGNIVDKNAPRPSTGDKIIELIEKHL